MIDQLPINNVSKRFSFWAWLHKVVITQKLLNPIGYFLLSGIALFIGVVVGKLGMTGGVLMLGVIIGMPMAYFIITEPKFGILVFLTASYFIMFSFRFITTTFPLGTIMDMLEVMLIIGFFIKQRPNKSYDAFKNPISYAILIWIGYNLLEVANPSAESKLAWVYTVRTVAIVTLMYFVFLYNITSVKYIRIIVIMWLAYTVFGAIYGIKQEVFGYSPTEMAMFAADPDRAALYFIDGHWRKISIYNDPVVFAYNMVLSSLLCIGLAWGVSKKWKKIVLWGMVFFFFFSMLFSGTRGAFALIPIGVILFAILNFNRQIAILAIIGGICFLGLIFMPTSNPNIHRFQTAFKPGKDASYLLRQQNQARIRPFIQTHPMGGGLGSVGIWGQKFAPWSMLAHFPPDSGYVRVAVEMGTIGIILFCIMMFIILRTGIVNFFKIKDRELRAYCLAMTIMIFALNIGNYPQEALVQHPTAEYFYLMIALLNKCLTLDEEKQRNANLPVPKKPYVAI